MCRLLTISVYDSQSLTSVGSTSKARSYTLRDLQDMACNDKRSYERRHFASAAYKSYISTIPCASHLPRILALACFPVGILCPCRDV